MKALLFIILVTQTALILAHDEGCQKTQNVETNSSHTLTNVNFVNGKAIQVDYTTTRSGFLEFELKSKTTGEIGTVTIMKLDDEIVMMAKDNHEDTVLDPVYSCFCSRGETKFQLAIDPNPNSLAIKFEDYEHTFPLRSEKFHEADTVKVTNLGEKEVKLNICSKGSPKPLKEGRDTCPACCNWRKISIGLMSSLILLFILSLSVLFTMCIKQRCQRSGDEASMDFIDGTSEVSERGNQ